VSNRLASWPIAPLRAGLARAAAVLGLCAAPAFASDGAIELSQARIEAAGGFPYTISQPGSYRLTSDLAVPANTTGLRINADRVYLDLGGHAIDGPFSCGIGNCVQGTAAGIEALGGADETTVLNGTVSGFTRDCLFLNLDARAENLRVRHCGRDGISFSARGLALHDQIGQTGGSGLHFRSNPDTSGYAGNVIHAAALGAPGYPILGGFALGGNLCGDGSCSPAPQRLFYLTGSRVDGDSVLSACALGFHAASLFEIHDPSGLTYDTVRGQTRADAGKGPPSGVSSDGWVRTGYDSGGNFGSLTGTNNCDAWTSIDPMRKGAVASLEENWSTAGTDIGPVWELREAACSTTHYVWCVQN
jgi:hypothetical protein